MKTKFQQWLEDEQVETEDWLNYRREKSYSWHKPSLSKMMDEKTLRLIMEDRNSVARPPRHMREEAIRKFGFAILDGVTVKLLLDYDPYLEIGCGTGYWAYELQRAGADVIATDPKTFSDVMWEPEEIYTYVEPLTAEQALDKYGDQGRTLLTVWPSYDKPHTGLALKQYWELGGLRVVYVGEGSGGCTADDVFHSYLDDKYQVIKEVKIPRWWGINDYLSIHQRKDT